MKSVDATGALLNASSLANVRRVSSNRLQQRAVWIAVVKESLLTRIVRFAHSVPEDGRAPYAFEKRIMAFVRSAKPEDVWSMWLPTMRRAAFCGLAVLLMTGAYIKYTESRTPDLLAGDLERTVLASVDLDETW